MTKRSVIVPADRLLRDVMITVRVSGIRRFRIRVWLGGFIMRLGARVMGCRGAVVTMAHDGAD